MIAVSHELIENAVGFLRLRTFKQGSDSVKHLSTKILIAKDWMEERYAISESLQWCIHQHFNTDSKDETAKHLFTWVWVDFSLDLFQLGSDVA